MHARFVLPTVSAVVGVVGVLGLAGCATTVALSAAPDANNPACANVMVRLGDSVGGEARRSTNAQSTATWGDPASVILRCGLAPSGPSTLPCFTVDDIDWLRDSSADPVFRFVTFGRSPAVEVTIDSRHAAGTSALGDLANAIATIPATDQCLDATDPLAP